MAGLDGAAGVPVRGLYGPVYTVCRLGDWDVNPY